MTSKSVLLKLLFTFKENDEIVKIKMYPINATIIVIVCILMHQIQAYSKVMANVVWYNALVEWINL